MGDHVVTTRVVAGHGLPRRKAPGPGGRWEVLVDGRWIKEEIALEQGTGINATPAAGTPSGPVTRRQGPTAPQREAWDLVAVQGMYQADAARRIGVGQARVISRLEGYMRAEGITGTVPGRMPPEEVARRRAGRSSAVTTSASTHRSAAVEPDRMQDAGSTPEGTEEGVSAPSDDTHHPSADAGEPETRCAVCGCTDEVGCPGGCWWVDDWTGAGRDLCSNCWPRSIGPTPVAEEPAFAALIDAELERVRAELALVDAGAAALEHRRQALQAVLANLEPARDAYAHLVETERSAAQ